MTPVAVATLCSIACVAVTLWFRHQLRVERRAREVIEQSLRKAGVRMRAEMGERSLTVTVTVPQAVRPQDVFACALADVMLQIDQDTEQWEAFMTLCGHIAAEEIELWRAAREHAEREVVFWRGA